jgi:4'-phosphopantetheinyl transferase EntD
VKIPGATTDGQSVLSVSPDHLAAAIAQLFPPACRVAVEPVVPSAGGLKPLEAAAVEAAAPKRRNEFTAGRLAARRALAALGVPDIEIPVGAERAPQWPANIVGSISHTGSVAVAVVAPKSALTSVGVDVELDGAVQPELWPLLLRGNERAWIESQPTAAQRQWATRFFSAKEAFYKFQHPLTRRWLDFRDVEITAASADSFVVRVPQPPEPLLASEFHGRMQEIAGLTVTAVSR